MNAAVRASFALQDQNICHDLGRQAAEQLDDLFGNHCAAADRQRPTSIQENLVLLHTESGPVVREGDSRGRPRTPSTFPVYLGSMTRGSRRLLEMPIRDEFNPEKHEVTIPAEVPDLRLRCHLNYVKLHGSFNWNDGTDAMLIVGGGKKGGPISLSAAASLFRSISKQVLTYGDRRLLVIGYSFHDDHVNEVIADAVRTSGLRLMVVDSRPVDELRKEILLGEFGDIWKGIVDVVNRPLAEIFATTPSGGTSGELHRFRRSFLDFTDI